MLRDKKHKLVEHLKNSILTLELVPGDDLDEVQLSKAFDISRTPLRQVFHQLAAEGYLELRENRGARVSAMSYSTLRDFFVAAPMIYCAISQLAVTQKTKQQLDALRKAQADFVSALASDSAYQRALTNNRFHEIIGEMANNVYLMPSFKRLLIDHARIGMTFYRVETGHPNDHRKLACDQHEALICAIEAGDSASAVRITDAHWQLSRSQIELFVTPAALDVPLPDVFATTSHEENHDATFSV